MRVLHAIANMDPRSGGPPVVAASLAAALSDLGISAGLAFEAPDSEGRERQARALADIPGLDRVERLSGSPRSRVDRLTGGWLARLLTPELPRCDFVHLHGAWDPCLHAAARACRAAGVPYALCPHGMLDEWCLAQSALKKRLALRAFVGRSFRRAAFVHVLNAHERDTVRRLAFGPPCEVLPNGIFLRPTTENFGTGAAFRAAHGIGPQAPVLLFLARLHHKKGLDILADALPIIARAMPELVCVVAGPDGGALPDFRARIAAHGLAERVRLPGPIYGDDKAAALAAADCFCLPSRQEGFSMSITEALASGTPSVVTRACHFPEITEAHAGVECDLSADAVARGVLSVLSDRAEAQAMGRRGRALVEQRFTWPAIAATLAGLYTRSAARAAGPGRSPATKDRS